MYSKKLKNIRFKIYQYRMNNNISAYELSLKLGKNKGYISDVENGKINISLNTFLNICEILKINPNDFFN